MTKASKRIGRKRTRQRARRKAPKTASRPRLRDVLRDKAHREKRLSVDPVARLVQAYQRSTSAPDLDRAEEQAAREIPEVYQAVTAGIFARATNFDASGGTGEKGLDRMDRWSARLLHAYLARYRPWATECNHTRRPLLDVAIDYLWEEKTFAQIDYDHRWRRGTARDFLREAIRRYAIIAEWMTGDPMPPRLGDPGTDERVA